MVLPVFLFVVLAVFQLGLLMLGREDVQQASQYGAQVAMTEGPQAGADAARQLLTASRSLVGEPQARAVGSTPTLASITASAAVQPVVAIPGLSLSVQSTSVGPVQQLASPGR